MMNQITPYCDYVFTGGEPFANLDSLQMMLDKIPETHKVYINTTLPVLNSRRKMTSLILQNTIRIRLHASTYPGICSITS